MIHVAISICKSVYELVPPALSICACSSSLKKTQLRSPINIEVLPMIS